MPLSPQATTSTSDDVPPPDPSRTLALPTIGSRSSGPTAYPTSSSRSSSASLRAPVFPEETAVPCGANPPADRILALLRRTPGLLPAGVTVTVRNGPLCAGTWQYTMIELAGREPLQVVTQGSPDNPQFVTAGTDVCTAGVRADAPSAILTLAGC